MTSSSDPRSPRHLLAIDLESVEPPREGLPRVGDRLSSIRAVTTLVFVGGDRLSGLPEPDYIVNLEHPAIVRHADGETLEGWPGDDGRTDVESALAHVAEALMIPPSDIFLVIGAGHPLLGEVEHVIVVGGEKKPVTGVWAPIAADGELIAALREARLLGRPSASAPDVHETAFERALDSLQRNVAESGFTAASVEDNPLSLHDANYAAVWARDGVITGLWTLPLDDPELIDAFRRTIRLLARHQAPSGQIPSYVRLVDDTPDYSGIGGIASIDSVLWFVIGAVRLAFHTKDRKLAEEMEEPVTRAMGWLAAHDANNDGLIEIPEASDWMDLFPRSYNVLYDEVLWYQACRDTAVLLDALGGDGSAWQVQAERVVEQVGNLFWPTGDQLMEFTGSTTGRFSAGEASYLLSQVTPFDYGWRCDVYANLLAALAGLLDEHKRERLFTFLWGVGVNSPFPVVCLYPPILSGAEDWKDYFLVNFLNLPDHYHNGGIWPFIGGLWVRELVAIGRTELAHRELASLAEACRQGVYGEWEFNEWLHGKTGRPMGKAHQAWSAASYVNAYLAVHDDAPAEAFPALDPQSM